MATALYICYFGIREPLVQTQVLPYIRELAKGGHRMSLVTFEPELSVAELQGYGIVKLRQELADEGIDWHWLRYHKKLSVVATAWDIFCGTLFAYRFIRLKKPDLIHARVHVPMLMAALARKLSRRSPKLLFDIRGFLPEEYTDAGVWPENGWLYRTTKRVEKWLLNEAEGFVVLTEKAREILFSDTSVLGDRAVEVIPCCVSVADSVRDGETRATMREELGVGDRYVIAYTGSFGGWYLSDEMYELFETARETDPKSFVLILTQRDVAAVRERLRALGFEEGDFLVTSVSPEEVPRYLAAADCAVSFIKRCYSKQASSPTKNAEYLAAGLPIIANSGVGDVDELIETEKVGVLINEMGRESYREALAAIKALGDTGDRCRDTARRRFDMEEIGGERYRRLYERMIAEK